MVHTPVRTAFFNYVYMNVIIYELREFFFHIYQIIYRLR